MPAPLPQHVKDRIVEMRREGRRNQEIRAELGVSLHAINRAIRGAGLSHGNKRSTKKPLIKADREAGMSYQELMVKYGLSHGAIWNYCNDDREWVRAPAEPTSRQPCLTLSEERKWAVILDRTGGLSPRETAIKHGLKLDCVWKIMGEYREKLAAQQAQIQMLVKQDS